MNDFQRRLSNLSQKLDNKEPPVMEFMCIGDWVVVKNKGEERRVVGFNLGERDAKILVATQTEKVVQDNENGQELTLISFQPMREQEARIQGLLSQN